MAELNYTIFYIRHPAGKGAGKTSDYHASIHDIAPTVLGLTDIQPPVPMEGQDLTAILEGKEPEQDRPYFTLSIRNDGSEARLYDIKADPKMNRDLSGARPDVVKKMWNDYIIKDAGGQAPPAY